jgi:formamidopyrimidine-DNA glycosylase
MPELPEVETVRRVLNTILPGKKILRVDIRRDNLLDKQSSSDFCRRIAERNIIEVDRRGKFLLIKLDKGKTLMLHLGMSGRLLFSGGEEKHIRLKFFLSHDITLSFHDPRMFGRAAVCTEKQVAELCGRLGPEPLEPDFTASVLFNLLRRRKASIKSLLLNQNFIAGLGNIYADESLFRAGIAPFTSGELLTYDQSEILVHSIKKVLNSAVSKGGTSISDFMDPRHRHGTFQYRLRVYGREKQPCPVCGAEIKKTVVSQRGTHWCPHCQI